jgi:ATP-dependent Clp protease ATP-binding subunit ClpB
MRRAVQRLIQDPLALKLLAGDFIEGETVVVDVDPSGKAMTFEKGVGQPEGLPLALETR